MTVSNEIKIGIVVLAATIIGFLGFRFMRDEPLFSSVNLLYTKYDNVDGLIRGSTVYVNGFKMGSVRSMEYLIDSDSILVEMSITEPISIPVGSKAFLNPDILGSAAIEIERTTNPSFVDWGGTIQGIKNSGLLDTFTDEGASIADSVKMTLELVNKTLRSASSFEESKAASNVSLILENLRSTTESINSVITARKSDIDSLIQNANNTMGNLSQVSDSTSDNITAMVKELEKFSTNLDSLSQSLQTSTQTLNSILTKIDTGEGTIGLMLNDPSLYHNLDSLTFNLNDLILKIQEDPGRYLKHMRLVDLF